MMVSLRGRKWQRQNGFDSESSTQSGEPVISSWESPRWSSFLTVQNENAGAESVTSDPEMDSLIERLGEKKKPLDEVRDFFPVRLAIKELGASK